MITFANDLIVATSTYNVNSKTEIISE